MPIFLKIFSSRTATVAEPAPIRNDLWLQGLWAKTNVFPAVALRSKGQPVGDPFRKSLSGHRPTGTSVLDHSKQRGWLNSRDQFACCGGDQGPGTFGSAHSSSSARLANAYSFQKHGTKMQAPKSLRGTSAVETKWLCWNYQSEYK